MRRMENVGHCQIIMATHSPVLMAYPNARLLRLTKYGLEPVTVKETDHYKVMREFCDDPKGFVEAAIAEQSAVIAPRFALCHQLRSRSSLFGWRSEVGDVSYE
jgi:hypothetical protein